MDRQSLIERLQKAFDGDERQRNTSDISDVEYKGDTNTLYVKEQKLFNMQNDEPDTLHVMSEEEFSSDYIRNANKEGGALLFSVMVFA